MRNAFIVFTAAILFLLTAAGATAAEQQELYYAIEQNGTICGYAHVLIEDIELNGLPTVQLVDSMWLQISLMGKNIQGEYRFTYAIDPASGMYFHHTSDIEQEAMNMSAEMSVRNDTVIIIDTQSDDTTLVTTPPGTLRQNTRLFPHLVRWFVEDTLSSKSSAVFNEVDGVVNEVLFTKLGVEELKLVGQSYSALKVKVQNRTNGIEATLWLDSTSGLLLKMESIRNVFLTDAGVRDRISAAEFDRNIFAPVGVMIGNPWALSYMKVKARLKPASVWLTEEALNVGGQSFTGTVVDNQIEGVFEVRHDRYDGSKAPPFPCDFSGIDSLEPYLSPANLIESDHPSLIAKAQEITAGASDAWEAATRLSRWVNQEIGYDIPGGGTALKTYELRLGECGSHANLLTAFCRAVGIPARGVFGCMYVPEHGGAFGQHAWNEIFMGEAGWIPIDCTADEVTYADCGHIRVCEWTSAIALLNPDTMEILDYRVGEGSFAELVKTTGSDFTGLLGEYRGPDKKLTILEQEGRLALDIPGQMVFQLKDPDENGERFFVLTDRASVEFDTNSTGEATSLTINSRQRFPRKQEAATSTVTEVAESCRGLVGEYTIPMQNAPVVVSCRDDQLYLAFSPGGEMLMARHPNGDMYLVQGPLSFFEITFEIGSDGNASAMNFCEVVACPKLD